MNKCWFIKRYYPIIRSPRTAQSKFILKVFFKWFFSVSQGEVGPTSDWIVISKNWLRFVIALKHAYMEFVCFSINNNNDKFIL